MFEAEAPAEGKPSAGRVALPDGRQVLYVVTAVHPGNPEELPAEQRQQVRRQLAELDGAAAADAYVRQLRQRFRVEVREEQL